jgi:hypothetical protein
VADAADEHAADEDEDDAEIEDHAPRQRRER